MSENINLVVESVSHLVETEVSSHPVVREAAAMTAAAGRERLEPLGLPELAVEALVREGGPDRHRARVAAAEAAALTAAKWTRDAAEAEPLPYPQNEAELAALGAALITLEVAGVGGRDNVEGLGTARMPCFRPLGKGRKQARDGAAWTAALEEAARRLLDRAGKLYSHPEIGQTREGLAAAAAASTFWPGDDPQDGRLCVKIGRIPIFTQAIPLAWTRTVVREGLRRSAGMRPWHPGLLVATPAVSAPAWGRLLEEVERLAAAARAAGHNLENELVTFGSPPDPTEVERAAAVQHEAAVAATRAAVEAAEAERAAAAGG